MFQPLLDLIQKFIDQITRIANAVEIIAKAQYVVQDVDRKEREIKEERKREDDELRKKTLAELNRLKIPYSNEMPTEQLVIKLDENREKAEAKLAAAQKKADEPKAETKKPEAKPEAPKAEPKKDPVKDEPKGEVITDEMLKAEIVKISEVKGDVFIVDFFKKYPLKTPAVKFPGIAQEERAKFLTDLKAAASSSPMDDMLG